MPPRSPWPRSIEAWLADVRYRSEQEQALGDVKRSLARLCIERAQNLFARELTGEGMLWLARALENVPPDSPRLDRVVRASLGGWHASGQTAGANPLARRQRPRPWRSAPTGGCLATACADRTARLWDLAQGAPLSSPIRHERTVRALAFSPDGQSHRHGV